MLVAGLAGEGLGKGARVTRVRFGGSDGGRAAPASGTPAAREGWPRRLPSAGERRLGEAGKQAGELRVGRRKVEEALGELAVGRKRELTAAGLGGAGGQLGCRWGGRVRRGERQRRLYKGRADLLATIGLAGDAPGDARAGRRGRDRRSIACTYGGSVFKTFPVSKASGGA
jgi:hypothetical protein